MKAADVMTRSVATVGPDDTVRRAARIMDELNVGALPVVNDGAVVGIITDRDVTVRITAVGRDPDDVRVRDAMSDGVRMAAADDDVTEIERLMSEHQIRRVPIVDEASRIVGIISLGDLAEDRAPGAGEALRRISIPSEPDRSGTDAGR